MSRGEFQLRMGLTPLKVDCTKTTPKRVYRRRQPEKSVLYRAMAQHFESFLLLYEQRFEKSFGYLRAIVRDTVYRFLDCGILESGFARARCKSCGYEFAVGLSCKARCLCPSCHKKRELIWAHWAGEQLLEEALLHRSGREQNPLMVEARYVRP